jgi:hypothetical protein
MSGARSLPYPHKYGTVEPHHHQISENMERFKSSSTLFDILLRVACEASRIEPCSLRIRTAHGHGRHPCTKKYYCATGELLLIFASLRLQVQFLRRCVRGGSRGCRCHRDGTVRATSALCLGKFPALRRKTSRRPCFLDLSDAGITPFSLSRLL